MKAVTGSVMKQILVEVKEMMFDFCIHSTVNSVKP